MDGGANVIKVASTAAVGASLCGGASIPLRVHWSTYRSSNLLDCTHVLSNVKRVVQVSESGYNNFVQYSPA